MRTKFIYPAVLTKESDGYSVWINDVNGCNSCGETIAEALEMVKEALGLCLEDMKEKGIEFPEPSAPESITLESGQIIALVEFDWLEYQKKYCTKSVKKTLTIPIYLNEIAEKEHINFSAVLREALEAKLNA